MNSSPASGLRFGAMFFVKGNGQQLNRLQEHLHERCPAPNIDTPTVSVTPLQDWGDGMQPLSEHDGEPILAAVTTGAKDYHYFYKNYRRKAAEGALASTPPPSAEVRGRIRDDLRALGLESLQDEFDVRVTDGKGAVAMFKNWTGKMRRDMLSALLPLIGTDRSGSLPGVRFVRSTIQSRPD